jgi:hypothetical protein
MVIHCDRLHSQSQPDLGCLTADGLLGRHSFMDIFRQPFTDYVRRSLAFVDCGQVMCFQSAVFWIAAVAVRKRPYSPSFAFQRPSYPFLPYGRQAGMPRPVRVASLRHAHACDHAGRLHSIF